MPVVIHVTNASALKKQLASMGAAINNGVQDALRRTTTRMSKKVFERAMLELVSKVGAYGTALLHPDKLNEFQTDPDVTLHMMPQHDADWRPIDNLAHHCLVNMLRTLNAYHTVLHKFTLLAAQTGRCDSESVSQGLQLELLEHQAQHLAYVFILQSHLELCSEYGRGGSALLHIDRIRSQVEERAEHRVSLFKQSQETDQNAQTTGRGKKKTNKTKPHPRKVDRSNVSDQRKDQRRGKSRKGVETKKGQARSSRTAKVRKG